MSVCRSFPYCGGQPNLRIPRAAGGEFDRVGQQVVDGPPYRGRIEDGGELGGDVDAQRDARKVSVCPGRANGFVQHTGQVGGLGTDERAGAIGAGQEEQVLGQLGEPVDLMGGMLHRLRQLFLATAGAAGQLQLGPQDRQGGAQLVTRVGDEVLLAREAGSEAAQQLVQRHGKAGQLVARGRDGQALNARAPVRGRVASHPLHRAKRCAGQHPGAGGHQQHEHRERDKERVVQIPQRLVVGPP